MKHYKKDLLKGFEKRKFELIELQDGNSLPWWIEEKWILKGMKSESQNDKLYVNFLTDKQWESGTKTVDEIIVSELEMKNYSDFSSKIAELDMRKGIFSEKLEQFWIKFDNIKELDKNNQWAWYEVKYEMAEFILSRLEDYKENYNIRGYSLPDWILDVSEKKDSYSDKDELELKHAWNKELDKMIDAFKQLLNYTLQFDKELEYNEEKIQEGLNKFSKYYLHLWD
ncbi:hypothetical protein BTO06_01205 [Tenacibaculum sp. SZ-18]|uniref:hypothetical protein n=1 Tax=Tenacibaculum sp. SZ-18 TaxID=754423 RepID=UPI000C2D67FC|nr:hypothetical protein [Tenacibaculum sp. SZ-18]AUC13852.1 hypothetical protein BTO06_01205 [Tenacibaculum sp. SZ-18]